VLTVRSPNVLTGAIAKRADGAITQRANGYAISRVLAVAREMPVSLAWVRVTFRICWPGSSHTS
jgi:hypothetical protein